MKIFIVFLKIGRLWHFCFLKEEFFIFIVCYFCFFNNVLLKITNILGKMIGDEVKSFTKISFQYMYKILLYGKLSQIIIMDNKQGTVIGLGLLALSSLYYFYSHFSQDASNYKSKRNKLFETYTDSKNKHHQIDLTRIKQKQTKTMVILPNISNYTLQNDTFKIYKRSIPRQFVEKKEGEIILQNQTGGTFTIIDNNVQIKVDIKDCNINTNILQQKVSPNIIFNENKHKNALFYSSLAVIKAVENLAIYGAIRYSLQENKLTIEPEFIVKSLKTPQDTVQQMISFWDQKIYNITFKKLAISLAMVTLGYLTVYRPIKKIWERYKTREVGVSEGQLDYFKQRINFGARTEAALNCQYCKTETISYVYECGHLVACDHCEKQAENHVCAICGKKSKKFMKIFI